MDNQIPTCESRISSGRDVAQSGPTWQLQLLALINVTNVAHYFPESEEMQKGHMCRQQQGVRSTKKKTLDVFPDTPTPPPVIGHGIMVWSIAC